MSFLPSRILPALNRLPTRRALSSTSVLRSATPQWEELIGGRAGIERKRKAYEGKYAAAMEQKAKSEGVSVEELKRRKIALDEAAAKAKREVPLTDSKGPVEAGGLDGAEKSRVVRPAPSSKQAPAFTKPKSGSDSPVKVRLLLVEVMLGR
jgi:ATP synthase F1 complex assembly factor 1